MSNELDKRRDTVLQSMMDVECLPAMPDLDLAMNNATKIPLANLSALGVAFQRLLQRFRQQSLAAVDLAFTMSKPKACRCFQPARDLSAP